MVPSAVGTHCSPWRRLHWSSRTYGHAHAHRRVSAGTRPLLSGRTFPFLDRAPKDRDCRPGPPEERRGAARDRVRRPSLHSLRTTDPPSVQQVPAVLTSKRALLARDRRRSRLRTAVWSRSVVEPPRKPRSHKDQLEIRPHCRAAKVRLPKAILQAVKELVQK